MPKAIQLVAVYCTMFSYDPPHPEDKHAEVLQKEKKC